MRALQSNLPVGRFKLLLQRSLTLNLNLDSSQDILWRCTVLYNGSEHGQNLCDILQLLKFSVFLKNEITLK